MVTKHHMQMLSVSERRVNSGSELLDGGLMASKPLIIRETGLCPEAAGLSRAIYAALAREHQ